MSTASTSFPSCGRGQDRWQQFGVSDFSFVVMIQHDPLFVAPPITEALDYVWSRQYDKPCFLSGRPVQKPKDTGRRISHPDAESALEAAKRVCRAQSGRWFGRTSSQADGAEYMVYEGGKVIGMSWADRKRSSTSGSPAELASPTRLV